MSENFDPYYKWLGIPPKNQPPTHYRLLGIELFESDREVIDSAANRLMAYLKTLSTGEDATHAQRLLNEAAGARRCLLDPQLKADYDAQLSAPKTSPTSAATPSPPPALPTAKSLSLGPAEGPRKVAPATPASVQGRLAGSSAAWCEAESKRRAQNRVGAARRNKQAIWFASIGACAVMAIVGICIALSSASRNVDRQASLPPAKRTEKAAGGTSSESLRKGKDESTMSTWRPGSSDKQEGETKRASPAAGLEDSAMKDSVPASSRQADKTTRASSPPAVEGPVVAGPSQGTSAVQPPAAKEAVAPQNPVVKSSPPAPAAGPPDAPPPLPPGNPFAGLGTVLDLPPTAKIKPGEETGLGPLPIIGLKDAQFVVLGADEVYGHAAKVTAAAVEEAKPGRWRVELREGDGDPQALAEFCLEKGQLQFSWAPGADSARADLLRNCFLEISADQHQQCFALRKAQTIEPLTIQNEKGAPQSHPIPVAAIRSGWPYQMEVLGVSGAPPYYLVYQRPLASPLDKWTNIQWNDAGSGFPVCAQILLDPVTASGFSIRTRLLVQPPNEKNPKLDRGFVSKANEERIKRLDAATKHSDAVRPPFAAEQKQELDQLNRLRRLKALSVEKGLRESVRIHFKIFTTIAGHRLDLLRSEPEQPMKK